MKKAKQTKRQATGGLADQLFVEANVAWDQGDLGEAFELFTKAANLGDYGSQIDLGYFFDQGLFVKKNKRKAIAWYRKAYRSGIAGGANNIATVYRDMGEGSKMLWWFRRAAAMGDAGVQLELARRYSTGTGLTKNLRRAVEYYQQVLQNEAASPDDKGVARRELKQLSDQEKNELETLTHELRKPTR